MGDSFASPHTILLVTGCSTRSAFAFPTQPPGPHSLSQFAPVHSDSLSSFLPISNFSCGLPRWCWWWQCRRHKRHGFDPWVGKLSWRRAWQLIPVSLPGDEELGRLWSIGLQGVGHNWSDSAHTHKTSCIEPHLSSYYRLSVSWEVMSYLIPSFIK